MGKSCSIYPLGGLPTYTLAFSYSYIFADVYGISQNLSNTAFLGLLVGILLPVFLLPWIYSSTVNQLQRDGDKGSGEMLNRENRLYFAMIGAPTVPIGLFWMAWTDYVSCLSLLLIPNCLSFVAKLTCQVIHFNLVADSRFSPCRVRDCVRLHVGEYVYHRLLRDLRCICANFQCFDSLYCSWCVHSSWNTIVRKSWDTLDVDSAGGDQYIGCSYPLRPI